jgi:hypothetical protein
VYVTVESAFARADDGADTTLDTARASAKEGPETARVGAAVSTVMVLLAVAAFNATRDLLAEPEAIVMPRVPLPVNPERVIVRVAFPLETPVPDTPIFEADGPPAVAGRRFRVMSCLFNVTTSTPEYETVYVATSDPLTVALLGPVIVIFGPVVCAVA